jgi:hypothetical protein
MKTMRALSFVALLLATYAWAKAAPNPADYTINVHVTRSRMEFGKLNVVIDGKKYLLEGGTEPGKTLALGDYKAKVVKDEHAESYYLHREYEFMFPDNKTKRFSVIGATE